MGVISFVDIKGFGPHLDTCFELEDDDNFIYVGGPNNAGKSFLIDALQVCLMCGTIGAEDYSRGMPKKGYIKIGIYNRTKICTRNWGGTSKAYELEEVGKPTIYIDKVSGTAVQEVQEFTGFKPVIINKAERKPENTLFIPLGSPPFELASCSSEVCYRIVSSITSSASLANAKMMLAKELDKVIKERDKESKQCDITKQRVTFLIDPIWDKYKQSKDALEVRIDAVETAEQTVAYIESVIEKNNFSGSALLEEFQAAEQKLLELEKSVANVEVLAEWHTVLSDMLYNKESNDQLDLEDLSTITRLEKELLEVETQLNSFRCEQCNRLVQVLED